MAQVVRATPPCCRRGRQSEWWSHLVASTRGRNAAILRRPVTLPGLALSVRAKGAQQQELGSSSKKCAPLAFRASHDALGGSFEWTQKDPEVSIGGSRAGVFLNRLGKRAQQQLGTSSRKCASLACRASPDASTGGGGGAGGTGSGGGSSGGGGGGEPSGDDRKGHATSGLGIAALWSQYLALLDSDPLPTKAISSMILNALGDLICQFLIEGRSSVDVKRLVVTATLGLLLVGPTLHYWYGALSRIVPGTGTGGAAARLILDQFVFSPAFIATFFCALLTLEGRPNEIGAKLNQDWGSAVVANWKLWIPFQFFNFRFVPLRLQVAAANVCAVVWTAYLSLASHKTVD